MTEERNHQEEQMKAELNEQLDAVATPDRAEEQQDEQDTKEACAAAEDSLAVFQNEIARLEQEMGLARDQALRAMAEVQNVKRRAEQDVEKAHKFALDKFVESLLPVVDSLEQGLKNASAAEDSQAAMREGMELTLKLMLDTLAKHKVEQLNPMGEPLDPNFHQAITMVPNPDMEPNTVMDVVQKGYSLNGRCVRPAMVVVAAAAG